MGRMEMEKMYSVCIMSPTLPSLSPLTSGWIHRFFRLLSMTPTRASGSPSVLQNSSSFRSSSITFSISGIVLRH